MTRFARRPGRVSFGEKAMECTTKSRDPHFRLICKDALHFAGDRDVKGQHHFDFKGLGQRKNIFLCLFVKISNDKIGTQRTESPGAAPGDRVFVRNANNQTSLALEKLGFGSRNEGRSVRNAYLADGSKFQVLLRDHAETSKGLLTIFCICKPCDFPPVYGDTSFTPGGHVYDIFVLTCECDKFFNRGSLSDRQVLIDLPSQSRSGAVFAIISSALT